MKGVLMLLVIAGHAMELAGAHSLILWIGSGFRMPLMLGISGYLLNISRVRSSGLRDFLSRYGKRLLVPWGVAVIIYATVSGWHLSPSLFLELVLRPPFHLWYVPVLFFLISATWALPVPPLLLLALGTPFSLIIMYMFGLSHGPVFDGLWAPDSRFLRYPVYFFFGMLVAQNLLPRRYLASALLFASLGTVWWASLYGSGMELAYIPARLLMCLGLIGLLPIISAARIEVQFLNAIGRNSLFFYLWHPLVMGLLILADIGPVATLGLSILLLAVASSLAARSGAAALLLGISVLKKPLPPASSAPALAV